MKEAEKGVYSEMSSAADKNVQSSYVLRELVLGGHTDNWLAYYKSSYSDLSGFPKLVQTIHKYQVKTKQRAPLWGFDTFIS